MNAALAALLCGLLALQDAAPLELPPPASGEPAPLTDESTRPAEAMPAEPSADDTPGPRLRSRRRSVTPAPPRSRAAPTPGPDAPRKRRAPRRRARSADEAPSEAPVVRAPRRRVVAEALPLQTVNRHTAPMKPASRGALVAGQAMAGGVGALALVAGAGAAAVLARTVDRPAGGLWRAPVPLGGLLPLVVGLGLSGLSVTLGVVGLGYLAERRLAAPAAALAVWLVLASVAAAVGVGAVFWPARESSRTFALRENTVAITLVTLAVAGPVLALGAWHLASVVQERVEDFQYRQRVKSALMAREEDAANAARRAEEKAAREKAAADAEEAARKAAEEAAKTAPLIDESTPATPDAPAVPADPAQPMTPAQDPPVPGAP